MGWGWGVGGGVNNVKDTLEENYNCKCQFRSVQEIHELHDRDTSR